jgi:hypothetical protein
MRLGLLSLLVLLLAACASGKPNVNKLDARLYTYASAIRWEGFAAAAEFIDPALREAHAPSALQLQRYEQVQVSGYRVRAKTQPAPDEVLQVVEIGLVNRHTQVERSVIDRQRWRWDAEAGQWWLVSGLPDIAPR